MELGKRPKDSFPFGFDLGSQTNESSVILDVSTLAGLDNYYTGFALTSVNITTLGGTGGDNSQWNFDVTMEGTLGGGSVFSETQNIAGNDFNGDIEFFGAGDKIVIGDIDRLEVTIVANAANSTSSLVIVSVQDLIAVPEPGMLVGFGMLGLCGGFIRRRSAA